MTPSNLITRLRDEAAFTNPDIDQILNRFRRETLPKKQQVVKAGDVASRAYYIIKGCMRVYYEKGDNEVSAYFFMEDTFTNACESFIGQIPSRHFIETTEESEVFRAMGSRKSLRA